MSNIKIDLIDWMGDDLKRCITCSIEKPLSMFDNRPDRGPTSKRTVCTACRAEGQRRRYKKHCSEQPFKNKINKAKQRAALHDLPFDLDEEYLRSIWTGVCPVFGVEIFYGQDRGLDNTAELDKIVPKLGYVKGNVVFLSRRANRLKNDASLEDLKQLVTWMEKIVV